MNDHADTDLRMRPAQRADRAVMRSLASTDFFRFECSLELEFEHADTNLFELGGRIVGWESHAFREIAPDPWVADPIPSAETPWEEGDRLALIGLGLVLAESLPTPTIVAIHRLARTLCADERGARFTLTRAPLPKHPAFDDAGICQQIAAGSIPWDPVALPIADGYWPLRIAPEQSVWMLREATWA